MQAAPNAKFQGLVGDLPCRGSVMNLEYLGKLPSYRDAEA